MFVRFRQTIRRLQCTLIETRRVAGKVRHEHIASLGSIEAPPSIADRVAFWAELHSRLFKLSNRVDANTQGRIFEQIHARIPMPTADEQRQLQKENAEADERFWSSLQHLNAAQAENHKGQLAKTQRTVADSEAAAKDAAANAGRAKERLAKIERGEDVAGGLGKPFDFEAGLLAAGFTKRELRNMVHLADLFAELEKRGIEGDFWDSFRKHMAASDHVHRIQRAAERDVLRKHGLEWKD
jgi:hypothetical protein